jgi:hypothetical protein
MDGQVVENIVETKEFSYEYQAQDDFQRPLGAKQVFKGKTIQEEIFLILRSLMMSTKD